VSIGPIYILDNKVSLVCRRIIEVEKTFVKKQFKKFHDHEQMLLELKRSIENFCLSVKIFEESCFQTNKFNISSTASILAVKN